MSKLHDFKDAALSVEQAINTNGAMLTPQQRRKRAGRLDRKAQRLNTRDVRKAADNFERNINGQTGAKRARGLAIEERIIARFERRNERQERRADRHGGSFL